MKALVAALAALLLVGCTTPPERIIETQIVEVPIIVYPTVVTPPRPELEIDRLTEEDRKSPGVVANAYRITIVQLRDYAIMLETLIDAVNGANKSKEEAK
jgi:hypothetical protein